MQAYLACVAFVDHLVGEVLDVLESSGYAENTVVIFTGDHGYHMGEKDYLLGVFSWKKARVPLIFAGPDIAEGVISRTPVSLVDLYPTCIDFAAIQAPHHLDGHSLRGLLKDPQTGTWMAQTSA